MMPGDRQRRVLDWMGLRGIEVVSIDDGLEFMRARMADYADLPCVAVYRLPDRSGFTVIPGGKG